MLLVADSLEGPRTACGHVLGAGGPRAVYGHVLETGGPRSACGHVLETGGPRSAYGHVLETGMASISIRAGSGDWTGLMQHLSPPDPIAFPIFVIIF